MKAGMTISLSVSVVLVHMLLFALVTPVEAQNEKLTITPAGHVGSAASCGAVSGNYAYLGQAQYFSVLDISDSSFQQVAYLELPDAPEDIFISGNYAYLSASGLRIIDISDPLAPAPVGYHALGDSAEGQVFVSGNYAYVAAERRGLKIVDVSDPSSPQLVKTFLPETYSNMLDVFVKGKYAYVLDGFRNSLLILDMSDPSNPVQLSSVYMLNLKKVFVQGNYAYVAIESSPYIDFQIINISNPNDPVKKGLLHTKLTDLSGNRYPQALYVQGGYAYIGCSDGLWLLIVDVSNPNNPRATAKMEIDSRPYRTINSLHVFSSRAYLTTTNSERHLIAIDVSDPANPTEGNKYASPSDVLWVQSAEDYLYAASALGLWIYDMADPGNPALVKFYPDWAGMQRIFLRGNYLFGFGWGTNGRVRILDVSDAGHVVERSVYQPRDGTPVEIYVTSGYAYLIVRGSEYKLEIVDISDPTKPVYVSGTTLPGRGKDLFVKEGNTFSYVAYTVDTQNQGFQVIDVSNPQSPLLLGTAQTAGEPMSLWAVEDTVYIGSNTGSAPNAQWHLEAFNVSNSASPARIAQTSDTGEIWDVEVNNGFVFAGIKGGSVWVMELLVMNFRPVDICHSPSTHQVSTTISSRTGTGYAATTEGYGDRKTKDISGYKGFITQTIKIKKQSGGEGCVATAVMPDEAHKMGCTASPACVDQSGGTVQVTATPTKEWVFWKWTGAATGKNRRSYASPASGSCNGGCKNVATAIFTPWLKVSGQASEHICPVTENEEERLVLPFTLKASYADSWHVNTITVNISGDDEVTQYIKGAKLEWQGGSQSVSYSGGSGTARFTTSGLTLAAGEDKDVSLYLTFSKMDSYACDSVFKELRVAVQASNVKATPDNYRPGDVQDGVNGKVVVACIYNADKDEPYTSIVEAVKAAAPNNTILVCPGTYEENVNVDKSLTIRSTKGRTETVVSAEDPGNHVFSVTKDNTTIQGFTIEGAAADGKAGVIVHGSAVKNVQLLDNHITRNKIGVYLQSAQEAVIRGNLVLYNDQAGLYATSSTESTIQENSFSSNGGDGVYMETCQETAGKRTKIEKNSFRGNDKSGLHVKQCSGFTVTDNVTFSENGLHGVFIENSSDIAVTGNPIIERNTQNGISIFNCQLKRNEQPIIVHGNTIKGSKVTGKQKNGIHLEKSWGVRIGRASSKNTIMNHPKNGISLLDCSAGGPPEFRNHISGNIIKYNAENGISIESSCGTAIYGDNNVGPDNGHGISIKKSQCIQTNEIKGAVIERNKKSGVYLATSYGNTIGDKTEKNSIKNNGENGIYMLQIDAPMDRKNKIRGNNIVENGRNGIKMEESDGNIIDDENLVKGNKEHGIYLQWSDRNTIKGNKIEGNAKDGIVMEECSSGNMIEKNDITSNTENGISVLTSGYPQGDVRHAIVGNTIRGSKVGVYLESSCNIWVGVWDDGGSPLYDPNTIGPNTEAGIMVYKSDCKSGWGNYIAGNNIKNNPYGVYVRESNGHRIGKLNKIEKNTKHGVYLVKSVRNKISENTIGPGNHNGIGLVQCRAQPATQNEIEGNTIQGNKNHGVYLESSYGTRVGKGGGTPNQITSNTGDGIHLQNCIAPKGSANIIENNFVGPENRHGIYLKGSQGNEIKKNSISSNKKDGLYLRLSMKNKLHGNEFFRNLWNGIYLRWSSENEIAGSKVLLSGKSGIYLFESHKNSIPARTQDANVMENNNDHGLRLDYSHSNDFYDNEVKQNGKHGVILNHCRRNRFLGKIIAESNTKSGIVLNGSVLNEIEGTLWLKRSQAMKYPIRVRKNGRYGVHFRYSSNNKLSRSTISGQSTGLFLEYANNNRFKDCWIKVNGTGVWEKCGNKNNWGVLLITHNGNLAIIEGCSQPTSKFSGCVFTAAEDDAMIVKSGATPIVEKCSIYDNAGFGIKNQYPTVTVDARYNWWGDASGPGGAGPGSGDEVSSGVDFANWRTTPVAVVVNVAVDTVFLPRGSVDSLHVAFQNWQNPDDVLDVTVSADSMNWLVSASSFSLALVDSMSADTTITFSVPPAMEIGAVGKFVCTAVSRNTPSYKDVDSFLVFVYNSQLAAIDVEPDTVHLRVQDVYLFSAAGYDSLGKPIDVPVEWHSEGGSIDRAGLFRAGNQAGSYRVWAVNSQSGLADTSYVTILPYLASVTISPDSVRLEPGQTQQFAVSGQDTLGQTLQMFPLWSAVGGVISSSGLYTAGNVAGTYWVSVEDKYSSEIEDVAVVIITDITAIDEEDTPAIPTDFAVYQNYPNPFNPSTTIRFDVAKSSHVEIFLYDVIGRQVAVLVNGKYEPGRYQVVFNAAGLPSGVYFYTTVIGRYRSVNKMLIVK
ncbi:MAG: DUF1565 domain-containing protein [Chlorobi bacterium]|nr:DUF1565 domain-containing protein [Chlorobiota bacterium]